MFSTSRTPFFCPESAPHRCAEFLEVLVHPIRLIAVDRGELLSLKQRQRGQMERIPFGGFNQIRRHGFYGALLSVLLWCQTAAGANIPPGNITVREPVYAYEGQMFTIEGSFEDPDVDEAHTVRIFWEGGAVTATQLAPGVLRFTASYTYYYDSFMPMYPLVEVEDEHGASDVGFFVVTVLNVAPTINAVVMNNNVFDEGDSLQLEVEFSDPGLYDHHRVEIDWGDLLDRFDVPGRFFTRGHAFFDDTVFGSGISIGEVAITVWDESDYQTWRTNIVVRNVPPTITELALSSGVIAENGTIRLSGHFEDRGWSDYHSVSVDWGDGGPLEQMSLGEREFTLVHTYRDDPPAGQPDLYAIRVRVTDDDDASSVTNVFVGVTNIAPRLSNVQIAARVPAHSTGVLKGIIEEPGPLDSLTLDIDWGDRTGTQRVAMAPGSTTFAVPHIFRTGGQRRNVRVTVRDDDGGLGRATAALEIVDPRGVPPHPPALRIVRRDRGACVEWDTPGVVLQSAPSTSGPWTDVTSQARSPLPLPTNAGARFFRIREATKG
jgi:hypothetical protein